MPFWLVLTVTLPTAPSSLRVRVWRALKATGAAPLREGVVLLPAAAPSAGALRALEHTIRAAGAEAHLLELDARDARQQQAFERMFDRSEAFGALIAAAQALHAALPEAPATELRRRLRRLQADLHALQRTDPFPGAASRAAAEAIDRLARDVAQQLSPGEPAAEGPPILRRSLADHRQRTWATRRRPWIDRLASAWLITRFVDPSPRFVWLDDPADLPPGAIGYDFDGATFTHAAGKVTFEVLAESFGLLGDGALQRLGALVRCLDIGGLPVAEAPGVEMLVRGLQARQPDDDDLLAAALPLFDATYAALQRPPA